MQVFISHFPEAELFFSKIKAGKYKINSTNPVKVFVSYNFFIFISFLMLCIHTLILVLLHNCPSLQVDRVYWSFCSVCMLTFHKAFGNLARFSKSHFLFHQANR